MFRISIPCWAVCCLLLSITTHIPLISCASVANVNAISRRRLSAPRSAWNRQASKTFLTAHKTKRTAPTTTSSSAVRKKSQQQRNTNSNPRHNLPSVWYYCKVALAGGIAGAVGSALLYPVDAAKTLRQSSPSEFSSVFSALTSLGYTAATISSTATDALQQRTWHIQNVYRGVVPGALGAIPSSALYFGAYESMKTVLQSYLPLDKNKKSKMSQRLLVHALAAASGNVLSSAVFVPKELIKQQLQYRRSGNVLGVVVDVMREKGVMGLYVGYQATLLRNVPTAVLRFCLYEEFRARWDKPKMQPQSKQRGRQGRLPVAAAGFSPKFFLAGAVAGAIASGVMTPIDVIKTRLATGTCPVDVRSCLLEIIKTEGPVGLYSGAGSRMFFSGAFSAIGFGTFEWAKQVLGVSMPSATTESPKTKVVKVASSLLAGWRPEAVEAMPPSLTIAAMVTRPAVEASVRAMHSIGSVARDRGPSNQ